MTEFIAEDNACGQNLLQIVAGGNAIIAELLRLKDYIPDVFWLKKVDGKPSKYAEIVFDFSYFEKSDALDKRIENDLDLDELDKRFRDNYIEILKRFYLAFECIHQYVVDLNCFITELNDGMYIQQTLESVFQDEEGKQMLIESLYLYGIMLLVVDLHIPGIIRERLLVSYHRYSAQTHGDSTIDDVCKLLRSTGLGDSNPKRIVNYPEEYFKRITLDSLFVEMVIGHLRSDDIYHQITIYPLPEHRTTALANQAGMLYICLYFSAAALHKGNARMREIVDKFFPDNWIISIYMGITVNLIDAWEPFKAAKTALNNTIQIDNVKEISIKHSKNLQKSLKKAQSLLKDANQFTEVVLTKNIKNMLNLLRRCNVTLRWFMLHTATQCTLQFTSIQTKESKLTHKQVLKDTAFKEIEVFDLVLNVSQLELRVRDILKQLLTEKQERWLMFQNDTAERIDELSVAFSGEKPLLKMVENVQLKNWFAEISKEIKQLSYDAPTVSERKIIQLIKALEEVQEFHNLDANMQVKQHLTESRQYLHQMIQTVNIKEETLINIQIIGDLSYAWLNINNYTEIMQHSIIRPPYLVINLRAIFLKLASALEIPLLRINQAHSEDLGSVSQYFSKELVKYVRKVVNIIPKNIFNLITEYIYNETHVIKKMPAKIEKSQLKEYAQLDQRKLISTFTMKISALTEGILTMKTTLVGVIELDPKLLLEDGIRKELSKHLSDALNAFLVFSERSNVDLDGKLSELIQLIDRYRWSFDYIQDYLHINGSKIFEEEMSKIITYNVENECNTFVIEHKPLVNGNPVVHTTEQSINFIGRFAREVLRLTDPGQTIYQDLTRKWISLSLKTPTERFSMKIFTKCINAIGPAFLIGIDRFYAHLIAANVQDFFQTFEKTLFIDKQLIDVFNTLRDSISGGGINSTVAVGSTAGQFSNIPQAGHQFYLKHSNKFQRKQIMKFQFWLMDIGRLQILRKEIAFELNKTCQYYSKHLESSLRTLNDAVLLEFKQEMCGKSQSTLTENNNNNNTVEKTNELRTEFLWELNRYLECVGLYNPQHKIYFTLSTPQCQASMFCVILLFILTVQNLLKIRHPKLVAWKVPNSSPDDEDIDGVTFVTGIATILRQFHRDIVHLYIEHMSQYIVTYVHYNLRSDSLEIRYEAGRALDLLQLVIATLDISNDILEKYIPNAMQNQFPYFATRFIDPTNPVTPEDIGFIMEKR